VSDASRALRTVRIQGFPLAIHARAQEQHAELMREFALLDIVGPSVRDGEAAPQRLLDLIADLNHKYAGISEAPDVEREAAHARGDASIDLSYDVPASVADACESLSVVLDEADEFCRQGARLLTLAAEADLVAFRHWYLGEFVRQIRGEPPTPWPVYAAQIGVKADGAVT